MNACEASRARLEPSRSPLIARQPILDRHGRLMAYELLYRGGRLDGRESDTTATARVLVESIGSIGLAEIAGSAALFVNFGRDLLHDPTVFDLLPPESIVIEILETVEPSSQLCRSIAALRARGFRIALDDYMYRSSLEPLLDLADYVKIDVLASKDSLEREVERLTLRGLQRLAEKVETRAEFDRCLALGFDLFQGYYFCRPETLDERPLAANQLAVLELVTALQDPTKDAKALAHIINRDVALSYQLLKLANSPLFRRRRPIAAMQDAMVILGLDSVKKWATLLMLSRFASGKPSELLRTALVRAYMCSSLAANGVSAGDHTFFTTGLLSVLDALLDRPMARVLSDLALVPDVTDALLGDACGPVGRVLRQVQAYEAGDWSQAMASNDSDSLRAAYLEAVSSADRVLAQVL
jgi:EAL and modified HD-GYP domain-containing signal transduction protein